MLNYFPIKEEVVMKKATKVCLGLILCLSILVLWAKVSFTQEAQTQPLTEEKVQETPQEEIQWVWGEVVSVDANNNQINVKYFDYETDLEKEMTLSLDKDTRYEGVASLLDIKPQDTVSIDYIIKEGKNITQQVNVEKFEGITPEVTPEDVNSNAE
jgi:hypothetical protein